MGLAEGEAVGVAHDCLPQFASLEHLLNAPQLLVRLERSVELRIAEPESAGVVVVDRPQLAVLLVLQLPNGVVVELVPGRFRVVLLNFDQLIVVLVDPSVHLFLLGPYP